MICNEVPFTLTGVYLADKSGYWENNEKYDDASAIYRAEFLSFESSIDGYVELMSDVIGRRFRDVGEIGKYRDLAWNLVALSALSVTRVIRGRLSFSSVIDIGTIYNKAYSLGGIAADDLDVIEGGCSPDIDYDSLTAEISLSYKYPSSTPNCQSYARTFGVHNETI